MDDGGIQVINRGYNPDREMWQQSIGKAYFTGDPNGPRLKSLSLVPSMAGIT
jgi:apolipoprotein D and lipocalin family protein